MYKRNDVSHVWRGWLLKSEAILASSIGDPGWNEDKEASHDCYLIEWGKDTMAHVEGWHASIKPMPVVQNLITHTTGIVFDPFLGSGTTLIACERLGRKCRAVEISAAYVAVAIQRWVDLTGCEPVLLEAA
jgi:hypothetical protein